MFYFCDTKGTTGNELCWAAVSQMIGAHYYGLLTQRQIVINVLGAEYNQGASDAQVRQIQLLHRIKY